MAGLPKRFENATLKNYRYDDNRVPKIYGQTCYKFATGELDQNCLLLCGNVGNGKTHLAIATLKNFISLGAGKTFFIKADELFSKLNFAATNQQNKYDLVKHYLTYDCLCIDGLEKKSFSEAVRDNMYLIINEAYFEVRRLIITTNFALETFKELDERIYSRLYEMSVILPFTWDDYRLKI